ncbi:DUF6979 family protein [Aeromonas hydrophila]|uniref:DUF6979 family protein n=1 Tax=Aeromonas hydrophila TaxID=644 RepID=UPI002B460897|nr:hypothetical protein [Aeromonas hydrophila]
MSYGKAAVCAAILCQDKRHNPMEAWELAVQEHIPTQSGRAKGCPKGAFLGLCGEGKISGISPGKYSRSVKNRDYALTAVKILQKQIDSSELSAGELWDKVMAWHNKSIVPNSQMEVVLALWKEGLIR